MSDLKLGFLASHTYNDGNVIRGAILITDIQTKPLEFRVTSPIKPTNFQKTLYGNILAEHILVDLITIPLLNSIKEKPDIIIVRNPLFLKANKNHDTRIIRIFKEDESPAIKKSEPQQLSSLGGEFEPVLIETTENLNKDLNEIRKELAEVFKNRNLLEPFDRIAIACKQVHAKNIGENRNA